MRVAKSKNKCMEGIAGIVVKETVRCLFIINKDNQVKNLLKQGSVFEFVINEGEFNVMVWGDNIIHQGSERTKVKFKEKYSLELY